MFANRLTDYPIITPEMLHGRDGESINGPSLIATPLWLPNRMAAFYLYFSHHKGNYIRMAYADSLDGSWKIYEPGTLKVNDFPGCNKYVASPDVHVDEENRKIRIYFHTYSDDRIQKTFCAKSDDGINFYECYLIIGKPYFRAVAWKGGWLGMAMDGHIYHSNGPDGPFIKQNSCLAELIAAKQAGLSLRHLALRAMPDHIEIYYTLRGDAPERIYCYSLACGNDITCWSCIDHKFVIGPVYYWEGSDLPITASENGISLEREHALRDPAIFTNLGNTYLLYAVAGEGGIAIARLDL